MTDKILQQAVDAAERPFEDESYRGFVSHVKQRSSKNKQRRKRAVEAIMKLQKPETDKIEKLILNAQTLMSDQAKLTEIRANNGEISREQMRYADSIAQKITDVLCGLHYYKQRYEK